MFSLVVLIVPTQGDLFGCKTLSCDGTTVTGTDQVAIGQKTEARGTQGDTAMGFHTLASGSFSTAMGYATTASQLYTTAMGASVEAKQQEALVVSGNIHAKNVHVAADRRLLANIQPEEPKTLLSSVLKLNVVSSSPSQNYCRHLNRTADQCAQQRTVGLIADEVMNVVPSAVNQDAVHQNLGTGARDFPSQAAPIVVEHVANVQGLSLHSLLAHLVGGMQAQSKQIQALQEENKALAAQVKKMTNAVTALKQ